MLYGYLEVFFSLAIHIYSMKNYPDRVIIEIHFTWGCQLRECHFVCFFIPGDTISCNITYPGRPGPPGIDGPPGRINEKWRFYTFPRVKELVR